MVEHHYNAKLDIPSDADSARFFVPAGYAARLEDGVIIVGRAERIRKELIEHIKDQISSFISAPDCRDKYEEEELQRYNSWVAYLEKQKEQKPNYCHHEVDLSGCSEEYRKAYYDGWNNCNMQHEQLKEERKDSPMPEDTVIFQKGVEEGRRLEREDTEKERRPIIDLSEFSDEYKDGYNAGFSDGIRKNLPEEIDSQIWQIANNSAKTWNESFAVLKAASDAYKRGKKDAQKEQKPEWSKEDEAIYDSIIREIVDKDMAMTNRQKRWFISLKNRGNFPKSNTNSPSWKPSEEQMEALFYAIADSLGKDYHNALIKLDYDIKRTLL